MLSHVVQHIRRLYLWCFAKRRTLDGGLVVYQGSLIAEGGFSYVYSGIDGSGRSIVLKQVRIDEAEQCAAAMREVEAHRRFTHPNLMPLLDFATSGRLAIFAFPLCERGSLRKLIDTDTAWNPLEFAQIFQGACRGVSCIHAAGFAHRDIKPDNILLSDRPKLMDFGSMAPAKVNLATRRDALVLQDEAAVHTTLTYRSPELWDPPQGLLDTSKADVWALGCVLWAMAYGYSPFEADFPAGSTTPRIVECTHLRCLSSPNSPPDIKRTRHAPAFFRHVQQTARALLLVDVEQRPSIDRALEFAASLLAHATDDSLS